MRRPPRLHAEMLERAAALAAGDGSWIPPIARPASTVVLLSDSPTGMVTYLMRRAPSMAFAAGMHVFPGGRIDEADGQPGISILAERIAADRMTADPDLARGIVVGAVREVFEETGVLLAVDEHGKLPVVDAAWDEDRRAVSAEAANFGEVLRRRGLKIDPDVLPLWSHWITPEVEERRYDVRFFVARVPEGQPVLDVSGEADKVVWMMPREAVAGYDEGVIPMLPPTVRTLMDLADIPDVASVLAHAGLRPVLPLLPRPRLADGEMVWEVIDARDSSVMWTMDGPPPDSEVRGTR